MKIKGTHFFMPEKVDRKLCLEIEKGIIKNISDDLCLNSIDLSNYFISPGFIDVHIHGFSGHDIGEGTEEALYSMSLQLVKTGVTAFLPTFISMPFKDLMHVIGRLAPKLGEANGAIPLGFHVEGLFVNREKCGAMNPDYFIPPSIEVAKELIANGSVKMFTVAPELNGAVNVIQFLSTHNISVSLGHTKTDFKTAEKAFLSGATSITHFFNAMPEFHHRDSGLIGAGLVYPFYLQFISDGVHTQEEVIKIMRLLKRRVVLITDCTEAGGLLPGEYMLGDYKIFTDEKSARLKDGTLAGSILTMDKGVKNLVNIGGFSVEDAIRSATKNPAMSINANRLGRIRVGNFANFTVLDKNLDVVMTIVEGRIVYDSR